MPDPPGCDLIGVIRPRQRLIVSSKSVSLETIVITGLFRARLPSVAINPIT